MSSKTNQQYNNREEIGSKSFIPPRLTSAVSILLKTDPTHHLAKEYLERKKDYDKNLKECFEKQDEVIKKELPELKPIHVEELYKTFKDAFKHFRGTEFNEYINKLDGCQYGEGAILARTICSYLLKHKSFFKSPILNKELNEPSFEKGYLIVGKMGTGKTSIIKTFYEMFLYANSNPIYIKDIEGTPQLLRRYKLGFRFYTTHEVVQDYHNSTKSGNNDYEAIFWKKHKSGNSYYDDLLTEKKAYGKDELFQEILEVKYNNESKTFASINYIGKETNNGYCENIETTFDALGNRYGERVYDRAYSMFNILELKGKSLRN